jgi:hypothetical protein
MTHDSAAIKYESDNNVRRENRRYGDPMDSSFPLAGGRHTNGCLTLK